MPSPDIHLAVAFDSPQFEHAAISLADEFVLPLLGRIDPREIQTYQLLLWLDESGLALQATGKGAPGPVRAEFVDGKAGYRRRHGGGTGQLIARAVGLKRASETLHIVDATAGLGQDAYVLAGLGCRMTLLERAPVIHALLADGLRRARANAATLPLVERMALITGDAIRWLSAQVPPAADVIYLDPMFPQRNKSARVKKDMEVFRPLVGADADAEALLTAALETAAYRVVVKRPRKAPSIAGPEPTQRLEGKSSRYDIYALRALP